MYQNHPLALSRVDCRSDYVPAWVIVYWNILQNLGLLEGIVISNDLCVIIPKSFVQRRIWTWSFLKCFWRASTWFHNNRYYNGTIYIIIDNVIFNVIVISDLVESSGYSSKTLKKGSCPYAPLDEALRYMLGYHAIGLFYYCRFLMVGDAITHL